ncbi:MAG: TatD family hydrolase [Opitutaceae bacterium]
MLIDAHNHLQDEWLAPHLDAIADGVRTTGISAMVVNGTAESDWPRVAELARRFRWVRPSFGLHPWDCGNAGPGWRETLIRTLDANPEAAVGEIGIDRWILDRARPDDPRLAGLRRAPLPEQEGAFRWQLELAAERDRPVTIHCIDAWGRLLELLRDTKRPTRSFLLHAYAGSAELAREFAALGAYFSFNGAFLADRHAARRGVFAQLPRDRLLIETDAPAMSLPPERERFSLPPAPTGDCVNHPANLIAAYAGLAELLAMPETELQATVAANFARWTGQPVA